jgi:uncharacterized membrane protein (DUF485 family)
MKIINDSPKLPDDVPKTIKSRKQTEVKPDIKKNGDDPYNKVRWQNRRRMAWTSLICMVIVTVALICIAAFTSIDMKRFETISEPLSWSYFGFLSVIGAYMGFTTWASKGRR